MIQSKGMSTVLPEFKVTIKGIKGSAQPRDHVLMMIKLQWT